MKTLVAGMAAVIAAGTVACSLDRANGPSRSVSSSASTQARERRAELLRITQSMEFVLSARGFDEMLKRGADSAVISRRRQQVESSLIAIRRQVAQSDGSGSAATLNEEEEQKPLCILNGTLDACFIEWWSQTPNTGSGSVHQMVLVDKYNHGTVTSLTLGSGFLTPPKTTSSGMFITVPAYNKTINYPKFNCAAGAQTMTSQTTHQIGWGIGVETLSINLTGEQFSSDSASCVQLMMNADKTKLGRNEVVGVTVEGMPASCSQPTVTSSNPDVISVETPQINMFLAYSGNAGLATLTAMCDDGSAGVLGMSVVVRKIAPDANLSEGEPGQPCVNDWRRAPRRDLRTAAGAVAEARSASSNLSYCDAENTYCTWLYYGEWDDITHEIFWVQYDEFCWDRWGNKVSGPEGFGDDGPVYRRLPGASVDSVRRAGSASRRYGVALLATGTLRNGRPIEVVKAQGSKQRTAVILIDTLKATAGDLAAALDLTEILVSKASLDDVFLRAYPSHTPGVANLDQLAKATKLYARARSARPDFIDGAGAGRLVVFDLGGHK